MNPPNLNEQLDRLAVRAVQLMGRLMKQKAELEGIMKGGFVDMAYARYNMGNKSVSALQIDYSSMHAVRTVQSSACNEDEMTFLKYSVIGVTKPMSQNSNEQNTVLRKRVNASVEGDVDSISANTEKLAIQDETETSFTEGVVRKQPISEETTPRLHDPIKWFGVLVPQSLKSCKQKFQKAVEMLGEIATTQSELDATRMLYREILLRKNSQNLECDRSDKTDADLCMHAD